MFTSRWCFLWLVVLASAQAVAQDAQTDLYSLPLSDDNQRYIDRLKDTPVKQIERGLPDESFDSWFSRLVKPKLVEYEVSESRDSPNYRTALWLVAYTQPPQSDGRRWIQVRFLVEEWKPSKAGSKGGEPKPFVLRFFDALEAPTILQPPYQLPEHPIPIPTGPLMKPDDRFLRLSELEESVRRSHGKETPRKVPL